MKLNDHLDFHKLPFDREKIREQVENIAADCMALGDRQAECETAFSDGFMYLYRVFRHASLYSGDRPGGDQHGADL